MSGEYTVALHLMFIEQTLNTLLLMFINGVFSCGCNSSNSCCSSLSHSLTEILWHLTKVQKVPKGPKGMMMIVSDLVNILKMIGSEGAPSDDDDD